MNNTHTKCVKAKTNTKTIDAHTMTNVYKREQNTKTNWNNLLCHLVCVCERHQPSMNVFTSKCFYDFSFTFVECEKR